MRFTEKYTNPRQRAAETSMRMEVNKMPRMNMKNGKKVENPGALLKRLMGYIMKHYGAAFIIVLLCILISVVCNVQGTMFMQTLIDNYIVPMLKDGNHDFSGLALISIMVPPPA